MSTNLMIVGVGGQGTLLASKVLGQVLLESGLEVKISEVHGMSQRGGSVVTYVKFGEMVYSPLVDLGEADYIVSFEKIEAARYAHFLKKDGIIVVNSREIDPMPVISGTAEYPHHILETLRTNNLRMESLDAFALAAEAGSAKTVNIVLLGRLSRFFDFPESLWQEAIRALVKPAFLEVNLKAFALGRG